MTEPRLENYELEKEVKKLRTALVHEKRYSEMLWNTLMMIPRATLGQHVDLSQTYWPCFVTDVQRLKGMLDERTN